jgi:DNA polymerase-3 subunit gamma/tau
VSYQVLARKWRPKTFKEVIGQPHVLTALENGLLQDRMHHAYLFSGTRGVGKTTIARILAKSLNCETGVTATPCGQCANCQAIDQGRFVDLLEIDAASRTKVDDTRELLDNVQYKPAQGRYKVYLIDEVHMLSKHSFNALLKTLEEPPEYVKFLLATTDPQKLPITVLSRCLQFHLKAILPEQIEQQLSAILTHEKATFEVPALRVIAKAADGSMRDALSLTDQALAFGAGNIQYAAVLKMLGTIDQSHLHYLLHFIASGNSQKVFEKIQEFVHLGADFSALHQELANLCHQIALMQLNINPNVTKKSTVQLLAERLTPEEVQLFYQIALQGFKDYPYAPNGKIALEMTVMRLLAFKPANYIDIDESLIEQLKQADLDVPADLSEVVVAQIPAPSPQKQPHQNVQPVTQQPIAEKIAEVEEPTAAVERQPTAPMIEQNQPKLATEPTADVTEDQVDPRSQGHQEHQANQQLEQITPAPEQQPTTPGASFNLEAITNSRNMLRSHRLKREELKKNKAATEQTTVEKNDRFVASEVTPITDKKHAMVAGKIAQDLSKETPVIVIPVKETLSEETKIAASQVVELDNDQDLPPLSSYQDQYNHIDDEDDDYLGYDYFAQANEFAADNALEKAIDVAPVTEHHQTTQVQNETSNEDAEDQETVEKEFISQHQLVDEYFSNNAALSAKQVEAEVENVATETMAPRHENIQKVFNEQQVTELDEAITVAPLSVPVVSDTKHVPVKFDIPASNVIDHTGIEIVLFKDDNFPRPELDIPAYVDNKMTDPWFLAIKAMQLSGFEKLLAKNCVMQQDANTITLTLHESQGHLLNNQTLCDGLKNILRDYYGKQYSISISVGEVEGCYTPLALEKIVYQQYLANAKASIKSDAIVQTFVSDYAAKVYENSVIPL